MPDIYAHYVFGEKMKKAMPEEIKKAALYDEELYEIGLHGPDILFYYKLPVGRKINKIGYAMHERPGREFFEQAAAYVRRAEGEAKDRALSYMIGFLFHYTLDRACHGYVQKKMEASRVSHSVVETEFDRYLLVKDGKTPLREKLTGHLVPSRKNASVIRHFFPGVRTEQLESTLKSMVLYNDIFVSRNPVVRGLTKTLMGVSGDYKGLRGLLMNAGEDKKCRDSSLRMEKLLDQAVQTGCELSVNLLHYLEGTEELDERFTSTFGAGDNWRRIPVLSYEEELLYEV